MCMNKSLSWKGKRSMNKSLSELGRDSESLIESKGEWMRDECWWSWKESGKGVSCRCWVEDVGCGMWDVGCGRGMVRWREMELVLRRMSVGWEVKVDVWVISGIDRSLHAEARTPNPEKRRWNECKWTSVRVRRRKMKMEWRKLHFPSSVIHTYFTPENWRWNECKSTSLRV
jgi:hypothetical protein